MVTGLSVMNLKNIQATRPAFLIHHIMLNGSFQALFKRDDNARLISIKFDAA